MTRLATRTAAVGLLAVLLIAVDSGEEFELEGLLHRMNVQLEIPEGAIVVPRPEQKDVVCQLAFGFPGRRYEVRCSFFPMDTIVDQAQGHDIEDYVPMFTVLLLMCIAHEDIYFGRMVELPEESVRREFGADHGLSALLKGGASDFSRGYRYVVVNSFYKKGSGIVNVYFLYDDAEELDMDGFDYGRAYYCFRFEEPHGR
jgi:hypothetical protein